MDHSLYGYLTRRTTEELLLILRDNAGNDDEVSKQIIVLAQQILSSKGHPLNPIPKEKSPPVGW